MNQFTLAEVFNHANQIKAEEELRRVKEEKKRRGA